MGSSVWEQRWQPLRREWVVVAAHRQDRPWRGATEPGPAAARPAHDPACAFCPGGLREGGARNPDYESTLVFANDRPCVGQAAPRSLPAPPPGGRSMPALGESRIVCFSPRHDLDLARMDEAGVDAVLACLQDQQRELSARDDIASVLLFENRGEAVGVSNLHPHGQVYATNFVWKTIAEEAAACAERHARDGRSLWEEIVASEAQDGARIVACNADAVAFVPWFARYAYETFVGPRRAVPSLCELDDGERRSLAAVLRETLARMDNLWRQPFPYVMALHQAPCDGQRHPGFGMHIELHPPLRKPALRKFLAGPEVGGGNFVADTCPDEKALELRAVSATHYLDP
jgi:UDPglucose--hexose-1-phosphate uridylyltransferase